MSETAKPAPGPRKHFTLPLQPQASDAHGYVVADLRDPDPKAEVPQHTVCAPCRGKALDFGLVVLHETPVGPSDRCQYCRGLFRGSEPEPTAVS
jgi:hypothetical protein